VVLLNPVLDEAETIPEVFESDQNVACVTRPVICLGWDEFREEGHDAWNLVALLDGIAAGHHLQTYEANGPVGPLSPAAAAKKGAGCLDAQLRTGPLRQI
jgi:hypothetical protein